MIDAWFAYQDALPELSEEKRATSTMAGNRAEANRLRKAFGHMAVNEVVKPGAYAYLDACVQASRPTKANKEVALMRNILKYGVRIGSINMNLFDGLKKNRTTKSARLVSDQEIEFAVEVGRQTGGPQKIVELALKTAWLCLRRSVEVRALSRDQIRAEGIAWTAAKCQAGPAQTIGLIQ